jgi:radical SAM superfamily enzyme YgiQ (UPF0313 family)
MKPVKILIDIIIVYIPRYELGHEMDFVPPITGIHLAALTPPEYQVNLIHQQVTKVNLDTKASLIAISFFSGFAQEAYRLATQLKQRGKTVIGGGPHVTYCAEEALSFFDSVIIGEAENVWKQVLKDYINNNLNKIYKCEPCDMQNQPTPRYDLLNGKFFIPRAIQATRGCYFKCSFCTVPTLNPGYRKRPINDIIKDIQYNLFPHWWQRKIVWFWDDNLTIDRKFIKELLTAMIPLKKWWLTQASMDIAKDEELLDLLKESGCIGIFFGIETFGKDSLEDANKRQNKIDHYKKAVDALHKRGICVMAGFISGFDHDTPETILGMADRLLDIGVDVPFLSILTPFKGTPLYEKLQEQERILSDRNWNYYNGYNVAFKPNTMTPEELLNVHRKLWKRSFSLRHSIQRIWKSMKHLRLGAFYMSLFMNSFYCYKQLRNNYPRKASN